MNLIFNSYSTVLLVSGLVTLLLALLLFRRKNKAAWWFGIDMAFIAWWAITYSLELSSQTLDQMLFWVNLEYIGIAMLPPAWVCFVIYFTGRDRMLTKRNKILLFVVPVITLFVVWTNRIHQLHYTDYFVDNIGAFPMLVFKSGITYWIFTVYFYLNIAAGTYLLLSTFKEQGWIYSRQKNIILAAALIPWVFNVLYLAGYRPLDHLDLTPYAFITSSVFVSLGLLRFNLFDIIPVAREKIVEALRDGVLVLDIHHRIIGVNGRMRRIINEASSSIVSSQLNEIFAEQKQLQEIVERKEDAKIEMILSVEGEERIFEVDINGLFEKGQLYKGAIILFRDITERKKSEEKLNEQATQLKDLNNLKDRLFSIIAHDLRSPILNLKLLVNMIDTGMITDQEFKAFVPELSKKLGYTSGLLENLLYWSKTQLDGQKIEASVFDLRTVVENEIQYSINKAKEKGIDIIDRILKGSFVYADVPMIELVIRNLLSNAIKFSSRGDTITISAVKTETTELHVTVKDTGNGMKKETLEKLFSSNTFTTPGTDNERGTGLGLQLCKDFIEKNKGRIWAESEEGAGTIISFTLPLSFKEMKAELQVSTADANVS